MICSRLLKSPRGGFIFKVYYCHLEFFFTYLQDALKMFFLRFKFGKKNLSDLATVLRSLAAAWRSRHRGVNCHCSRSTCFDVCEKIYYTYTICVCVCVCVCVGVCVCVCLSVCIDRVFYYCSTSQKIIAFKFRLFCSLLSPCYCFNSSFSCFLVISFDVGIIHLSSVQ
uniref:(northern house mosquito) hypothetical protein n=1 Tax=Culex pipiens TaxID=7175 RepID=A0A8D8FR53_CULPI